MKKMLISLGKGAAVGCLLPAMLIPAGAVGRSPSTEVISKNPLFYLGIAAVVAVIVAVVLILGNRNGGSAQTAHVIVVPPNGKKSGRCKAVLEAQGTFLNGKHYGIVSYAVIGRSSSADICAADGKISGKHCRVDLRDGVLYLTDLDSTNGTMLGGKRLAPNTPVQLANGSVFSLGSEQYSFRVRMN